MDLSTFELIAGFGTGVVVFGVTLEGAEILVKLSEKKGARAWIEREGSRRWLFSLLCTVRRIRPVMLWVEGIAIGIVVSGLAIEWFGTSGADRIQSQQNAALMLEAGSATNMAAQAISKAAQFDLARANAERETARIRFENSRLQKEMLELKKQVQWRDITDEQESNLIAFLKPLARDHFMNRNLVRISVAGDIAESRQYARRISDVLTQCGFNIELDGNINMLIGNTNGLEFTVHSNVNAPWQAFAILKAFKDQDIPVIPTEDASCPDDCLKIWVMPKPE